MFENLSERLERSFKILKGEGKITEINVAETVKDIRKALLDADVSYKVAKDFCNRVKDKAIGANVLTAVKPQQMMVKIMHDELADFMGSEAQDINIKGNPAVVLVAGLNGSGKTTFSGKLALHIKSKRGMRVLLAACDTFRPAAIEQLKVLGEGIGVPVYTEDGEKDPIKIAQNAIKKARAEGFSVVIVDTAGRLAVDQQLMDEISALHQAVQPTETLFVVDAMTGQDAVETAKAFNDRLDFDGVVLTKMDGDTRGGAALSIKAVVGKPIKFVSSGEKMEALDVFHPARIADRILGMGDVVSLVEKAQEQFDEKQARELKKKLAKDQFTLWDFYQQIQQVKKMGNIKDLAGMIPGVGKALKDVDIDNDTAFKSVEAIILSMTPKEREHPEIINGSRRKRIADGSGTSLPEVNRLLKQFEGTRKAMKGAMTGNLMQRMGSMRGMMGRH
ncbi:MAG: signal recognition particle protein [Bacteroidales bacterium]|nr:signal recognition particle protein [Bacteroidales bacterium]MBQ3439371.1 signal recognition particle protein [Bacteroidales bacterium]MBR1794651.1 signal recognition particle protein [Bacteroidales bacterium]